MDFRFQEPKTDIEPILWEVKAELEDQVVRYYANFAHGSWQLSNTSSMSYIVGRSERLEAALDKARTLACRDVKAALLDAEARRIRHG